MIKVIDESWWNMKNEEGQVGLVPKDYLQNTRPQPIVPDEGLDPKVCILCALMIGIQSSNS